MRRFLLATHGYFAEGMYSSLKMLIGEQSNVSTLCAYVTDNYDLKAEATAIIDKLNEEDELIIITDIFGGSINNEFMNIIGETSKKIHLIAGLNLPLVIELVSKQNNEEDTRDIISDVLVASKETIQYCNVTLDSTEELVDEEF